MKQRMLKALKANALGQIEKHKVNIEIYMHNAVGIGEHSDVMAAVESEIDKISHFHDQLEVIEKYLE
jgi:diacylglycerol kinase family enzyme|tara:strand:- start:195 stop:395 length:201 start_codon:yes stop_codon:yes gene_type:complete